MDQRTWSCIKIWEKGTHVWNGRWNRRFAVNHTLSANTHANVTGPAASPIPWFPIQFEVDRPNSMFDWTAPRARCFWDSGTLALKFGFVLRVSICRVRMSLSPWGRTVGVRHALVGSNSGCTEPVSLWVKNRPEIRFYLDLYLGESRKYTLFPKKKKKLAPQNLLFMTSTQWDQIIIENGLQPLPSYNFRIAPQTNAFFHKCPYHISTNLKWSYKLTIFFLKCP